MPAVLFAMVIMSVMAVAAINGSMDQQRSSSAVRRSGEAFYAAETGLNAIQAEWNDTASTLADLSDSLSSGGTLDLGWDTLPSGSSYHAEVMRINESGQNLFLVTVEGHDASGEGGQRTVTLLVTGSSGGGASFGTYTLGRCCAAAAQTRGITVIDDDSVIDGHDFGPPPGWDGGRCGPLQDARPGIMMDDTTLFNNKDPVGTTLDGVPPLLQQPLTDADFDNYGGLTYDSIRALVTTTLDDPGDLMPGTGSGQYGPRYLGDGSCDYSHPLNFGEVSGPCEDHFPIILCKQDCQWQGPGYSQGILVMDKDAGLGGEVDFETGAIFAGVIIGMGCVEIQDDDTTVYGAIFVDGEYNNDPSCNLDMPLTIDTDLPQLHYSSCAIQHALEGSTLGPQSDTTGGAAAFVKFGTRAFAELLR